MPHEYDLGYAREPFSTLVNEHPDETVYPQLRFRTEWGPVFHRGRLDGTARVVVIGQDPAQHENILRRALVGEAGQRVQGFLHKMGIDRSYVIINAFLYSVYGSGSSAFENNPGIIQYRNRWLDALVKTQVQAVVTFGGSAKTAWEKWKATPAGAGFTGIFVALKHPTYPESGGLTAAQRAAMLAEWTAGLNTLRAIVTPDTVRSLVPYGGNITAGDRQLIPEFDLPAGTPPFMRVQQNWAFREGAKGATSAAAKRRSIRITIPASFMP
jgi:hypothetical protein